MAKWRKRGGGWVWGTASERDEVTVSAPLWRPPRRPCKHVLAQWVRGNDASADASQDDFDRGCGCRGLVCDQPESHGLAVAARHQQRAGACRNATAAAGLAPFQHHAAGL